jgi:hypothetical protein
MPMLKMLMVRMKACHFFQSVQLIFDEINGIPLRHLPFSPTSVLKPMITADR